MADDNLFLPYIYTRSDRKRAVVGGVITFAVLELLHPSWKHADKRVACTAAVESPVIPDTNKSTKTGPAILCP
jgi:hypothetical protein